MAEEPGAPKFGQGSPDDPGEAPLAHRAVRGGLWVALSSYWTVGFGALATIVLTRLLVPQVFGTYALAMFFAQLFRVQSKLGLGYAFAQHQKNTPAVVSTYVLTELLAVLAGLLLALLSVPVLLRLGYASLVVMASLALALAIVSEGIAGIGAVLLEKDLHFRPASLTQALALPISYIPAFWLATRGGGVWSLIAQNATFNVLLLVGILWTVSRRMPHLFRMRLQLDLALARGFLRFGGTLGLGLMAGMLLTQLDNFLVGSIIGVTMLGFYDRAYRTSQWPSMLFNSLISRAGFNTYARVQGDPVRLQRTLSMTMWLIMMLAMPLALAVFVAAPDLLSLLYGERWLPSAPFLRVLVLVAVLRPLWENAGTLFAAIGKPRLTTAFSLAQALILVLAGWPLTLRFGAMGTCVAAALAFVSGILIMQRTLIRESMVGLFSVLAVPGGVSALTLIGYMVLNRTLPIAAQALWVRVVGKGVYAVCAYFVLTLALQPRVTKERIGYIWGLLRQTAA